MTFIKTNIDETNKRQVYRMTCGDSLKVDGVEKGTSIPIDNFALYSEGEKEVLTFTSGAHKYGTISRTFIKSFMEIVDIMEGEPFAIIVTGGVSKAGRSFVNCELDCT